MKKETSTKSILKQALQIARKYNNKTTFVKLPSPATGIYTEGIELKDGVRISNREKE